MIVNEEHGRVCVGKSCKIADTAVLIGPINIDDDVRIHHGVIIGEEAEHKTIETEWDKAIHIGNGVTLRENVVVQRGIKDCCGTVIKQDAYIMHGCHVAHDVVIERAVTMAPHVILGGHCRVMQGAYMGLNSCTHPFVVIGPLAMVAMGAVVVHDVQPCKKVIGSPARIIGDNTVGMERNNIADITELYTLWEDKRQGRKECQTMK